jgi:NitT/TauT family transport system substrate-binding protein
MRAQLLDRRETLTGLGALAAAGLWRARAALAVEPPPETTTIRLAENLRISAWHPQYIAEALLRAEGFTEIAYVCPGLWASPGERPIDFAGREIDFGFSLAASVVDHLGDPIARRTLGHCMPAATSSSPTTRCDTISDLEGRRVGVPVAELERASLRRHAGEPCRARSAPRHLTGCPARRCLLDRFARGEIDAFLGFPPEPQELRERGIGRVDPRYDDRSALVAVLLLHALGNRRLRRSDHPIATKRFCARCSRLPISARANPRWLRHLVDRRLHGALRLRPGDPGSSCPTAAWRTSTARIRCASMRSACTRRG